MCWLERQVHSGRLKAGDLLPGERTLAPLRVGVCREAVGGRCCGSTGPDGPMSAPADPDASGPRRPPRAWSGNSAPVVRKPPSYQTGSPPSGVTTPHPNASSGGQARNIVTEDHDQPDHTAHATP